MRTNGKVPIWFLEICLLAFNFFNLAMDFNLTNMKKEKNSLKKTKRREFLKNTFAASSILILPRHILGGVGYTAPSDQLGIAAIGAGGQGAGDIRNAYNKGKNRVVALCDVDSSGGNGISRTIKAFPDAKFYSNFKKMLDKRNDIDAVTIAIPDHSHATAASYAMKRGVHVYVEKPLTHNVYEARYLTKMARDNKIVTQMGNQGASNPDQLQIQKWINNKVIGTITEVNVWTNRPIWPSGINKPDANKSLKPKGLDWDLWLGPAKETEYIPNMHPFNWRGWWDYGTGALGDMGCHLMDVPFKALMLKYPTSVECSIGKIHTKMWQQDYSPDGCPPSASIAFNFEATPKNESNIKFTWMDGGIKPFHPDLLPPDVMIDDGGVIMIGEKGVITCNDYGYNPKLYLKGEDVIEGEKFNVKEPNFGHHIKWAEACKAGFDSLEHNELTSSFDFAGPLTETVLMGNIAIKSYMLESKNKIKRYGRDFPKYIGRKKLLWDGDNMRITNLEEANQFVGKIYRKGWELS